MVKRCDERCREELRDGGEQSEVKGAEVEWSDQRWREAIRGGLERSEVEGSTETEVEGGNQRWRAAIAGHSGGKRSEVVGSDQRMRERSEDWGSDQRWREEIRAGRVGKLTAA